jgi:phage gp36-like protein
MPYATQADLELQHGTSNVTVYSATDGSAVANTARISAALVYADAEIDRVLSANGYTTPCPSTATSFPQLKQVAVDLAMIWLTKPRNHRDEPDSTSGRTSYFALKDANRTLNHLVAQGIDCPRANDAPRGMSVTS